MNRVIHLLLIVFVCGCSTMSNKPAIQITHFTQGLVTFDDDEHPRIYKEGSTFPYKVNGRCVADKQPYPCMWRGFEFDYKVPSNDIDLNCTTTTSQPIGQDSSINDYGKNVSNFSWKIRLKNYSGHYSNPQYSIAPPSNSAIHYHQTTECTYEDNEVLRFEFAVLPQSNE